MSEKIKAIALKPLDGEPIGAEMEFDKADFDRLVEQNAVKAASGATGSKDKKAAPENKAAK